MTSQSQATQPVADEVPVYDLVVSVGTDYHKFDRLVEWVDAYLAKRPELTCLFQHGFTTPPKHSTANVDRMPRADLLKIYERAKVVLVQGGPGSILDAREVGSIPFSVPRKPELDEVVDGHQIEFARVMETYGETVLLHDAADLAEKIDAALANPASVRGSYRKPGADDAAAKLAQAFATFAPSPGHDVRKFARRWGQVIRGIVSK